MKIVGGLIDKLRNHEEIQQRHFNPYLNLAMMFSDILFTQQELKSRSNIFTQTYANLIVEIGCYFGKTLVEIAERNPSLYVLGLDITYKRVVKTAMKIKQNQLNNASVALCDGFFLFKEILSNNSIKGLCIFFPDPWLKTNQKKHRLLNQEFISLVFEKLQSGGFFWLKTDQESYFLQTQFLLLQSGFIIAPQTPPKSLNDGVYTTEFQNLFTKQNTPFFEGVFLKP